jgi:hypothetical protein
MANNDRIDDQAANAKLPKPEVMIIVNGQSVYKPGMKTFFIDNDGDPAADIRGSEGKVVGGTVCVCDAVCTCEAVCSCESYGTVCTCDAVCSCEYFTTCTCDSQCSCQSYSTGACSCNQVCTCVPVH